MKQARLGLWIAMTLSLLAAALAVEAQPGKMYRIGYLSIAPAAAAAHLREAFRDGLRERGYVEGQNLILEVRSAEGQVGRLPVLARELVGLPVDVIVTTTAPATRAANQATSTIPIVMAGVADPIAAGLVPSLARPGGNVTGTSGYIGLPEVKLLEVLKDTVPRVSRVGLLYSTSALPFPITSFMKQLSAAADSLRLTLLPVDVESPDQLPEAFATFVRQGANGVLSFSHGFNFAHRRLIVELANRHRLPSVFFYREAAEIGGLVAYGVNLKGPYRQAAAYVGKVLKGTKPADLPIEQPTKFELVINRKTAKALGLTIPPSVLARADEVIE